MMTPGEILGTWIAAGLTLMMFSFIYKDNVFYKIGEHLYLGDLRRLLHRHPVLAGHLCRKSTARSASSTTTGSILPVIIGIFIVLRLVPSLSWLSRMSFAFIIGGAAGPRHPQRDPRSFLPQLYETLRPFDASWGQNINQIVILVSVFTVIIFFFFSLEHKRTVGAISRVGLFFIMIGFGAAFGYTVMARISLLIGRFQFLIFDWIQGTIMSMFGGGGGAPG